MVQVTDLTAARYRINPNIRLHWADFGCEYVVFEETSGQTHQLDALRAFILNLLTEQALDTAVIERELIGALASSDIQEISDLAKRVLSDFAAYGLVEATI